jgi:hypothetical protein
MAVHEDEGKNERLLRRYPGKGFHAKHVSPREPGGLQLVLVKFAR